MRIFLALLISASATAFGAEYLAFSGGYAAGGVKGINAFRFDSTNGSLKPMGQAVEADNPSFLAVDSKRRFLFAVHETSNPSAVSSYAIDTSRGTLTLIARVAIRGSSGPCHLSLDGTGNWLAVANYGSGNVVILPVQADGKLGSPVSADQHHGSGPNQTRQAGPHAHAVAFSPDNRWLAVPDLGADRVYLYRFDAANGSITQAGSPAKTSPGAGPRHAVWHSSSRALYVVNELDATVTAFRLDASAGGLAELQTISTLPEGFPERSAAEIAIGSAATSLYVSNRGHNSIARFTIDPARLRLSPPEFTPTGGRKPRHFALDPTGRWLIAENQDSGTLVVFALRDDNGQLLSSQDPVPAPAPVGLVFIPVR